MKTRRETQKKQRRASPPRQRVIIRETIATLRDDVKDLVLDAARLWKDHNGIDWSVRLLAASVNVLAGSEAALGEAYGHACGDEEDLASEEAP